MSGSPSDLDGWGIIGGGFALYGYLPALVKFGATEIKVLRRFEPIIKRRSELGEYLGRVKWVEEVEEILSESRSLVVAVPPQAQESIVRSLPLGKGYSRLVLEKPLSTAPEDAAAIFDRAIERSEKMRVGFTILQTDWARRLKACFTASASYSITWNFKAHHFKANIPSWKEAHELGGGALRFYGIHLVALLASLGTPEVEYSLLFTDDRERIVAWRGRFRFSNDVAMEIDLTTQAEEDIFAVRSSGQEALIHMKTPFAEVSESGGEDVRIAFLGNLLKSFEKDNEEFYDLYARANSLWQTIEQVSKVERNSF